MSRISDEKQSCLRKLPSVNELVDASPNLVRAYGRDLVLDVIRSVLADIRTRIIESSEPEGIDLSIDHIILAVGSELVRQTRRSLRHCINATGVILSTSLGRAPLSRRAQQTLADCAKGYCTLAVDPETGGRGERNEHVRGLLNRLTGAESTVVVNNNASATMLIINTLAAGKEVIVSRGQLIEIGGAFRLPDVVRSSGATLVEVGTTNKTHLRDYRNAITERTGAILRVHHSNYRILGFAQEPEIGELVELGREFDIPVVDDIGSGAFVDLSRYGLPKEPMPIDSIRSGADIVCFSGDKLLSGPQAGIIAGNARYISMIMKNPLYRVLRVGKLTLAALEGTLRTYLLDKDALEREVPSLRMITQPTEEIERKARSVANKLADRLGNAIEVDVLDEESQVGGGSLPTETIPTKVVSIRSQGISTEDLAKRLRYHDTPVFTRVQHDSLLLDMRTVLDDELEELVGVLVDVIRP